MSTDRQKSFIAELSTNFGHLHFPRLTHNKKVTMQPPKHYKYEGTLDISNYLFADSKNPHNTLRFYFRCTANHYHIYIRTPGAYYGSILGMNKYKTIIATENKDAANFNLLDKNGNVITLDDISSNKLSLTIQTTHGVPLTGTKYMYSHDGHHVNAGGGGSNLVFHLNIIERNASYVDNPDEV